MDGTREPVANRISKRVCGDVTDAVLTLTRSRRGDDWRWIFYVAVGGAVESVGDTTSIAVYAACVASMEAVGYKFRGVLDVLEADGDQRQRLLHGGG